jgi:hypothetical protein
MRNRADRDACTGSVDVIAGAPLAGGATGSTAGAASSATGTCGSGATASGLLAGSCGFLRNQPNRAFFAAGFLADGGTGGVALGAGVFLSLLEPNMEDGYLKGATRQWAGPRHCLRGGQHAEETAQ